MAHTLNCSLDVAIIYFYTVLVGLSSLIAVTGLWLFAKKWQARIVCCVGVFILAYVSWLLGDEYILSFCTVAYIPLVLYLFEKKSNFVLGLALFAFGFIVVYANFCRIHTGTLLVLVIAMRLFLYKQKKRLKALLGTIFLIGFMIAQYSITSLFLARNTYLLKHDYTVQTTGHKHTFWHNVYPGLGFIENDKNLYFADACSAEKVKSINPEAQYLSAPYNTILMHEVMFLCGQSPHFVLRVFFAKLGVLFYYLLLCLLPAVWALCLPYMPLRIHACYWVAMVWGALPGLLTIPNALYILGFLASAWLYGFHAMVYALNNQTFSFSFYRIKTFFLQLFHTARQMEWQ